jgi:hypothetical protein
MNERIRQLAEQAEKLADDELAHLERVHNRLYSFTEGREIYNQKFAELIVRECANITLDYKNHDHYMGWVDHGEEIARQFGVER